MGYNVGNLGQAENGLLEQGLEFYHSEQGQSLANALSQMKSQSDGINGEAAAGLLGTVATGALAVSNPAGWIALGVTALVGGTKLVNDYRGQIGTEQERFEPVDSLGVILSSTHLYTRPKKFTKSIGDLGRNQMVKVYSRSGTSNQSWAYVGVGDLVGYVKYSKLDLVGSDYYSLIGKIPSVLLDVFVYRSCDYMYGTNVIGDKPCFGAPSLPPKTAVSDFSDSLLPPGVDPAYTAKFEDTGNGELWYWELDPDTYQTKSTDVVGFKDSISTEEMDSQTDTPVSPSPTPSYPGSAPSPSYPGSAPTPSISQAGMAAGSVAPILLAVGGAFVAVSILQGMKK